MIRVELIHGNQRRWIVRHGRWVVAILGAAVGCMLLYHISVKNWLPKDLFSSDPHYVDAVNRPVENESELDITVSRVAEKVADRQDETVGNKLVPVVQETADTTHATIVNKHLIDSTQVAASVAYTPSLERMTACFSTIEIVKMLPPNSQLELVSCVAGRYQLSGYIDNNVAVVKVEEGLSEHLKNLVSTVQKTPGKSAHLFFSGQEKSAHTVSLKTLSPDQAQAFFAEVEYWADLCGIDDIDLGDQSVFPTINQNERWRRKLVGTGSYGQIQSFLDRVATRDEVAVLSELILTPVSGADSYNRAVRISSAIDVSVSQDRGHSQ